MLIAIDYDFTYSEDPDAWDAMIASFRARGHTFVCVTGRHCPPDPVRERQIPMPVICAPDGFKADAARKAGYKVDVWIDDMPGTIENPQILDFGD